MSSGRNLSNVLHYQKPSSRPEPVLQPKPTVAEIKPACDNKHVKKSQLTELVYQIGRNFTEIPEPLSPWGPFHVMLIKGSIPLSVIAYTPILMAPPTDYNTIYTTLLRNKEIANSLGYKHLPIFFDMGLLTKALEITWAQPEVLQGIYPCEGGMHLLMAVMAAIGHLYGSAGIHQLLHDSGVFAAGTAHQILAGKDFDRGLYAIKLVDEVLNSLFLQEFEVWCKLKHAILPPQFTSVLEELLHECNLPLPDTSKTASLLDELEEVVGKKNSFPCSSSLGKRGDLHQQYLCCGMIFFSVLPCP